MHIPFTVTVIFALSILIAGVIAILRFAQIRDVYRPFIYLVWVACITELLSVYLVLNHQYNIIPYTIYNLCESLLLLWFFQKLKVLKKKSFLFFLIVLFVIIWVSETFLIQQFGNKFTYYFNIIYGFIIVLLCIRAINDLLFTEKELLKNPTFLICIGLIIFFTYDIINRMFRLYGLNNSHSFRLSVESLQMIINFLSNLIYALAVLWMRKKQAFTLQF
jgi:hypothetical protein